MLKSFHTEGKIEVGIDEVGRGCFAGPVAVAAVVFPTWFESDLIRDSKKLSERQREKAYKLILNSATAIGIQAVQAGYINEHGIEKATYEATKSCLSQVRTNIKFDHIIMDGNRFENPMPSIPYTTIVKGDDMYLSIAAASIIGKVRRDRYMKKVHDLHPQYNFKGNKGYFCKKHGEALLKEGKCRYHRDQYVATWMKKQK